MRSGRVVIIAIITTAVSAVAVVVGVTVGEPTVCAAYSRGEK